MAGRGPLAAHLDAHGFLVLDGGLATALEARGHDLSTALWSARLLVDAPMEITEVHAEYLRAGADCVVTASYQATTDGLERIGVPAADAPGVLASSTRLAREAVEAFVRAADAGRRGAVAPPPPRPLVAASVGPYGAALADGSEYDGRYGLSVQELVDFHERRFLLLAGSGADLLACETIPSVREAEALVRLVDATPGVWCWISFTCRDDRTLRDGTPVEDAAAVAADHERVAAVGINCTEPRFAGALVERIGSVTGRPVLAYPNSGERYDPVPKRWLPAAGGARDVTWQAGMEAAWRAGARVLGGCCRTGPEHVAALRRRLEDERRST